MEQTAAISSFFRIADRHEQIGTTHAGLYMALLKCWIEQGCHSPFFISRRKLMALSRIRSTSTYHICIKDLRECGVIEYIPSFHPQKGTEVRLMVV